MAKSKLLTREIESDDVLIHPITEEYAWKEPVPENFVSREEFINRTGVFVTADYFNYIYDMEFKKSGLPVDEFIDTYEKEHIGEIVECNLQATFKYFVTDELISCMGLYDDLYDPNIWEMINCLAREYEEQYRRLSDIIKDFKDITKEVLKDNQECLDLLREISNENHYSLRSLEKTTRELPS